MLELDTLLFASSLEDTLQLPFLFLFLDWAGYGYMPLSISEKVRSYREGYAYSGGSNAILYCCITDK